MNTNLDLGPLVGALTNRFLTYKNKHTAMICYCRIALYIKTVVILVKVGKAATVVTVDRNKHVCMTWQ